MESEVGSSTSKKRTETLPYQSRKRKGIRSSVSKHKGSTTDSPTLPEKTNGVFEISLTGPQNSSPLPKGNVDVILALSCTQQSPEKKQKPQRKSKSLAHSPNATTVSRLNGKDPLCEDQNQDVSINQAVEASAGAIDAQEQVGAVVRRKRTAKVKKDLMEHGTNIEFNTVENKHPNKKLMKVKPDSPGGKVLTTAKASIVNNKMANIPSTKNNKFENTTLWKSLEAESETEGEQEVREVTQKWKEKKYKEAATPIVDEQELCGALGKLRKEKGEEAVSQTVGKEICEDQQKMKKKKSKGVVSQTTGEPEEREAREEHTTAKSEEVALQYIDEEVCGVRQKRRKKKSKEAREAVSQIKDDREASETHEKRKEKGKMVTAAEAEAEAEAEGKQEVCEARQIEDEQEVCETQQKRRNKKCTEDAVQIQHEQEICQTQQKRRKKKHADQENNNLLHMTKTKDTGLENDTSKSGLVRNQEGILLDRSCLATQSKILADSANTPLMEGKCVETYRRKGKDKSHKSMAGFGCSTDQFPLEHDGDSSKIHKTQKSEFLLDQTPAGPPDDCKQVNKLPPLETDNIVAGSGSHTLKEMTGMAIQYSKKKKNKKKSQAQLIQSTHEVGDISNGQKTSHACDVAEQTVGDFPTGCNNKLSFIKANNHVDEIPSPIFSAASEQANPPESCKEDFDTSSHHKILAVDNSSADHPNKKKKRKKDKLKDISHVAVADGTNAESLNGCRMEEIVSSSTDDINDRVMSKDHQIGELGPSAGNKTDAVMVGTEIDNPLEGIAAVDDSSAELTEKRSTTRKRRKKGSKNTSHEANTVVGLSTLDTCLELPDSYAEGSIAASIDEDQKEHIPPILGGIDEKKHRKGKLKHTSQGTVADETNIAASNRCHKEEILISTRENKNDAVVTKDCQTQDIRPQTESKVNTVIVGTEIDNLSTVIDDSSVDLTEKKSASRKRRRKIKSENISHEANTLVGLSTSITSLELPDSCAEGSIATSFNEDQEQIPPIGDSTDQKKHKTDKLKRTSQVTVADEIKTTALDGCQMEGIVSATRESKNITVKTKDCHIEEPSVGSKVDTAMAGTEIDNPSERIASIDDSSVDLRKKRAASRKRRRKAKSECTSREENTHVGLSTLETSLELPDSPAQGTVATSFDAGQKDEIPPIKDGRDEVPLKNECKVDEKPPSLDHGNAVVVGPTVTDNEVGKRSLSPQRELTVHARRKLLILDLNGLLVDIVSDLPKGYKADTWISRKALMKRPFCDDFLKFCFEKFNVGVWSSRTKKNVESVVDYLFREMRDELLFCWDQSHCTETGFSTIENDMKPLVFKELKKLWEKLGHVKGPDLPWEKGDFNESNTLLLDDSPYKALLNPPHTAIFPRTFMFRHGKDVSLGPGGDIRNYLESVAAAEHVQKFVEQNPFGQHPITSKNPSWRYYLNVIKTNKFCLPA